jgi:hypothetical protein
MSRNDDAFHLEARVFVADFHAEYVKACIESSQNYGSLRLDIQRMCVKLNAARMPAEDTKLIDDVISAYVVNELSLMKDRAAVAAHMRNHNRLKLVLAKVVSMIRQMIGVRTVLRDGVEVVRLSRSSGSDKDALVLKLTYGRISKALGVRTKVASGFKAYTEVAIGNINAAFDTDDEPGFAPIVTLLRHGQKTGAAGCCFDSDLELQRVAWRASGLKPDVRSNKKPADDRLHILNAWYAAEALTILRDVEGLNENFKTPKLAARLLQYVSRLQEATGWSHVIFGLCITNEFASDLLACKKLGSTPHLLLDDRYIGQKAIQPVQRLFEENSALAATVGYRPSRYNRMGVLMIPAAGFVDPVVEEDESESDDQAEEAEEVEEAEEAMEAEEAEEAEEATDSDEEAEEDN